MGATVADAIARMVQYLTNGHEKWTPDRNICPGPKTFSPGKRPHLRGDELHPYLQRDIVTALRRERGTCAEIARRIGYSIREVNHKLAQMHRDGLIDRARTARSPVTRRLVQVYAIREAR